MKEKLERVRKGNEKEAVVVKSASNLIRFSYTQGAIIQSGFWKPLVQVVSNPSPDSSPNVSVGRKQCSKG